MTTSNALTATQWLLALIRASGGSIDSRIRLQKETYLLKWMGFPWFRPVRFKYHHYGPYSRYLSACLHNAVLDGVVLEHSDEFENGYVRYSYTLPEDLEPEYVPELEPRYQTIVERLAREKWRTLELGATVLFLEDEENTSEREAMQRALRLKPECQPYEESARELLAFLKSQKRAAETLSVS